jgi:hypothetical protein
MDWNEFVEKLLPPILLFITGALTVGGLWVRSRVQRDIQRNKTEAMRLQAEGEKARAAAAKDTIFNQIVIGQEDRLKRVETDLRESVKINNELEKQIIGLEHRVDTVTNLERQVNDLNTKYEADLKTRDEHHKTELSAANERALAAEAKAAAAEERIKELERKVEELQNRLDAVGIKDTREFPALPPDAPEELRPAS